LRAYLPWTAKIFSSTTLKTLYEPCEFENERLLAFVDNLDLGPKDSGYLDRCKLGYKPKIVEPPLLLAQPAERSGQQLLPFRGINVSILWRRTGRRHLVYFIKAFGLTPPVDTAIDVIVYDSLEPSLG
jgi:hypothetical protein